MLAIHIIIALFSILVSIIGLISPTSLRLQIASGASLMTVLTGTALIFAGYSVLHVCTAGLLFTLSASLLIASGYRKLARMSINA